MNCKKMSFRWDIHCIDGTYKFIISNYRKKHICKLNVNLKYQKNMAEMTDIYVHESEKQNENTINKKKVNTANNFSQETRNKDDSFMGEKRENKNLSLKNDWYDPH